MPVFAFGQIPDPMFGQPWMPPTYGQSLNSSGLFSGFSFEPDYFFLNLSVGNYAMEDMRVFQNMLKEDYHSRGLQFEKTLDFPISLQGDIGFDFEKGALTYGPYLNYAVTKGKLHYSDYSGSAFLEQNIYRLLLGGKLSHSIIKNFRIYGKGGINLSFMNLLSFTAIHGAGTDKDQMGFHSLGLHLEPGLAWYYPVKNVIFNVTAGYEFNQQGRTRVTDSPKSFLIDDQKKSVLMDWSGFRFGIGLGFRL